MDLVHPQLAAFSAVLEEGSFEAAARRLSITPSAMSQRIKALEDRLGQVLVVRQPPCRPTPAGEMLLRRVRPMQTLEAEALADLLPEISGDPASRAFRPSRPIAIAVNSDSLATWFLGALSQLYERHGYLFDVKRDDQDHTLHLLRDGSVLGAVTAEAAPLQGCEVQALGAMRYQAIASPTLAERYFSGGVDAAGLASAPMIVFNRKDELQWRFVRRVTRTRVNPPVHYLPSASGFIEAAALGLGWCLAPEAMLQSALQARKIVLIAPDRWLDVPLYWQHAGIRSDTLQNIGAELRRAAGAVLRKK
ncbi:LysR family transcriptional regulator ArgP [Ottowia thiooxydans]|uniref:LysR family transcriptional regulator (Chromosome initiation inhibitor) n=1 Tax=Ottowia thiooxydans TaxID=219182 RepID=A0ABV2Q792_9BURK